MASETASERSDDNDVPAGYVIGALSGSVFVQVPDDNQWGFSIEDDDQSWPGGFGAYDNNEEWELMQPDDPRITPADRKRLQWILGQITITQAARRSGLAPKTLRDAATRGALKAIRIHPRLWLTTERALQAYLDGRPERFKVIRQRRPRSS